MSRLSEKLRSEVAYGPNYKTFNTSRSGVKQLCLMYEEMEKVMRIISENKRKTKEQRLAFSCITFLDVLDKEAEL